MSLSVTSPIFFFFLWYIGAAQVHAVTHVASGRLDSLRESGGGGVSSSPPLSPFFLVFLC